MASLLPADEVTGSNSTLPFGRLLDEEDRRREQAALNTALDPQGDGSQVRWENAKSGAKGAIAALSRAYPSANGKVCRAFRSSLRNETLDRTIEGTACTVAAGQWAVRDAQPVPAKN